MQRYAAFLRGVSPMNAKMPELKRAFEQAGFADVKTLLASGNVLFSARATNTSTLARKAEAAMQAELGRTFTTFVRSLDALRAMLARDPFADFELPARSKRVVSFLQAAPEATPRLPLALEDARIWCVRGAEVFSSYVPSPSGPVFMKLIEKTFGEAVTTRTWETVCKAAR